MNKWEETFGVKFPKCKMTGYCCSMASPSVPPGVLLKKAAEGDSFARDFLNLFQAYKSREEAYAIAPELVDKTLSYASRSNKYQSSDQVVFYRCRFLKGKNQCQVYEDRPQLCRDYPDSPFLVVPPGCAYEQWSNECKKKYYELKEELNNLKALKEKLLKDQARQNSVNRGLVYTVFLLSPSTSWIR